MLLRFTPWIRIAVILWLIAETIAFVVVVKVAGVSGALLLAILTSVLGWVQLKRAGGSAMLKLRAAARGRVAEPGSPHFVDDALAAFGAIALLLPGFLSDLLGLVFAVAPVRERVARWARRKGFVGASFPAGQQGAQTIDLERDQWRHNDKDRPFLS
jgi:UPF0716 protein FxsA